MDAHTKDLLQETEQLLEKNKQGPRQTTSLKLPSLPHQSKINTPTKAKSRAKAKAKQHKYKRRKAKPSHAEQDCSSERGYINMNTNKHASLSPSSNQRVVALHSSGRDRNEKRSKTKIKAGEVPFGQRVQKLGEFEAKSDKSFADLEQLKSRSKAKCKSSNASKSATPKRITRRKRSDPYLSAPQKVEPIPFGKERSALGDREWENELARNILALYHSAQAREKASKVQKMGKMQLERARKRAVENIRLRQIWFAGTGVVPAVWCVLCREDDEANDPPKPTFLSVGDTCCSHVLCLQLKRLEQQAKYFRYVSVVENLLTRYSEQNKMENEEEKEEADAGGEDESELGEEVDIQEQRLWRQLVVCCNVFGVKLTEACKYKQALEMLQKGEAYVQDVRCLDDPSAGSIRLQLRAYLWDSTSFYYFRRGKMNAAAVYTQKAMKAHVRLKQWEHIAKCHLHCGTILSMMKQHEASIECLNQVLNLVHEGKLEVGGTNAQKICMVAVCYHNIAVEQLLLFRPGEACVASQNARRLAKLSLSYSNRWIKVFEATHQAALTKLTKKTVHPKKPFTSTDLVQRIQRDSKRAARSMG